MRIFKCDQCGEIIQPMGVKAFLYEERIIGQGTFDQREFCSQKCMRKWLE